MSLNNWKVRRYVWLTYLAISSLSSHELQDRSIEDEDPPETFSDDSDATVDEELNSSTDYAQAYPSSPDVSIDHSRRILSSPDISVCEFEFTVPSRPVMTQVSTPQHLKSNLLQRRRHISPIPTPSKPSNLRIELNIDSKDEKSVGSDRLQSEIDSTCRRNEERYSKLSRQERVYLSVTEILQNEKRARLDQVGTKMKEFQMMLSKLQDAELRYDEFRVMKQNQQEKYEEMRRNLWQIQSQINFAKQDIQSSIHVNQQIFEESVQVSKQLEETRMIIDQQILEYKAMIDQHNPKSLDGRFKYHLRTVTENFLFLVLYVAILLGIRHVIFAQ
jgi:hypothetical protein